MSAKERLLCLRSLAVAFTLWVFMGFFWLSLEFSLLYIPVAMLSGYLTGYFLESLDAKFFDRPPRYSLDHIEKGVFNLGIYVACFNFAMLTYCGELLWPVVFGSTAAVASMYVFRVKVCSREGLHHFLNPQNFALCLTTLLIPEVGLVPPYEYFTPHNSPAEAIIPVVGITYGLILNSKSKRLGLILSFHSAFFLQALVRSLSFPALGWNPLLMMTGPAYLYVSMFMMTDPGSTPDSKISQIVFGLSVGAIYAGLILSGVPYALFYSLFLACSIRGALLFLGVRYV